MYTCDIGYRTSISNRMCQETGAWSKSNPTCQCKQGYIGEGWREVGGRRERRLEQVRKGERKKGRDIGVERDSNYQVAIFWLTLRQEEDRERQ